MTLETILMFANYTTEEWKTIDTIIPNGCPCVEFDESATRLKIGDGEHSFGDLPYVSDVLCKEVILKALGFIPVSSKEVGQANGVVPLNEDREIDDKYLPASVKNIIAIDSIEKAPEEGKPDTLYVVSPTCEGYLWNGEKYVRTSFGDVVKESKKNGYLNINGLDVQIYEPAQIDDTVTADSENAVQSKAVASYVNKKMANVATFKKPGLIMAGKGLDVAADGAVSCNVYTKAEYIKKSDDTFISKGTLEVLLNDLQKQIDSLKR